MSTRTAVYKIYGDAKTGSVIANALAQPELMKLRAQIGVIKPVRARETQERIMEARIKYAVKPMPMWKQRIWGYIGLLVMLHKDGWKCV